VAKRRNQEGTFTHRPNGTWQARLGYVDGTGATRRLSVYGRTQREAATKLNQARDRIQAGQPARDSSMTVAAWCQIWIEGSLAASPRRPSTRSLMASLLRSHVMPTRLGAVPLARLRPSHIDAWVIELRTGSTSTGSRAGKPPADATVQRVFRVLRQAIDGAVRDGLLARNPVVLVAQPAAARPEARVLSLEEVSAILQAALQMDRRRESHGGYRTHHHTVFALIASTGLRKGEALALRWSDIDFERGTLAVRGTLTTVRGGWVISEPKTRSSRRVLMPSAGLLALLAAHRRIQSLERLHAQNLWTEHGFVFTSATGAPLDPRTLLRAFTTAAEQAGITGVSVHTLRHSAATAMLEGGIHLKAVSELLGHAGTQITAEVYAHLTTPTARRALEELGAGLGLDGQPPGESGRQLAYGVGVRHQEGPDRGAGPGL